MSNSKVQSGRRGTIENIKTMTERSKNTSRLAYYLFKETHHPPKNNFGNFTNLEANLIHNLNYTLKVMM